MTRRGSANQRVFIVDDDSAVRSALQLLAISYGWHADVFASAEEFLASDAPRLADACLIVDLAMPGMNGVELQRELHRRGVRLPTVIVTAHPENGLADQARAEGAHRVLSKPFVHDELRRSVESAMATPRHAH